MCNRLKFFPIAILSFVLLGLVYLNIFHPANWLNSDMAAEMIFAQNLFEEGKYVATDQWFYSTEFRILYTQLIMVPLFKVTSNWHVIRAITNLFTYALMLTSYFYLLKPFKVKKNIGIMTSVLLFLPFSETMMTHMQMGNTYMPHVILFFFWMGMFVRFLMPNHISVPGKCVLTVMFVLLSILCGMSGVRYILILFAPILLTGFLVWIKSERFATYRDSFDEEGKTNFIKDTMDILGIKNAKMLWMAVGSMLLAVIGYAINVLVIAKKYVFQTYGATNFIAIYRGVFFERVQNALGMLLEMFGYIPERSALSLRGFISVCSFVMLLVLIYIVVRVLKTENGYRYILTLYLVVMFCVNLFAFVFTTSTMVARYYIPMFVFCLPVLAFFVEGQTKKFDKYAMLTVLSLCMIFAFAKTVYSYLTVDKNVETKVVADFLKKENLRFGYATYWNGNIVTEMSNGEVEIANISDPENIEFFTWSSPSKYYEDGYCEGKVFMLLTVEETEEYSDSEAIKNGEKVYDDGSYVVYTYSASEELMSYKAER